MTFRLSAWRRLPFIAVVVLAACERSPSLPSEAAALPPEVRVATLHAVDRRQTLELAGRIAPLRVAEVRARASGIVTERLFEEGQDVQAGQVLFNIDPLPLQAAQEKAVGTLAGAEVSLFEAKALFDRNTALMAKEAISPMAFDKLRADWKRAVAARAGASAALRSAQLALEYATVRAPIAGRIGYALVNEGALVSQSAATSMARIQQLDSVYLDLTQSLANGARLQAALAGIRGSVPGSVSTSDSGSASAPTPASNSGSAPASASRSPSAGNVVGALVRTALSVEVDHAAVDGAPSAMTVGELLFADTNVDTTTAKSRLRARLPNADHRFLPGMFIRARVVLGADAPAIFVSQKAVGFAADGTPAVNVVDTENIVRRRPVTLGDMRGSDWQVLAGLSAGERVMTEGAARLSAGTLVRIRPGP